MKNIRCPKCKSNNIEEKVYTTDPSKILRVRRMMDVEYPQIIRECICKNCGHFWKEFV